MSYFLDQLLSEGDDRSMRVSKKMKTFVTRFAKTSIDVRRNGTSFVVVFFVAVPCYVMMDCHLNSLFCDACIEWMFHE